MTNERDKTRRINCSALRTLHGLERMLNRHERELMELDCEDAEAAEAIVYALQQVEKALEMASAVKRLVFEGGTLPAEDEE